MSIQATRYHDISCGHRVVGHESKCRHLHGHNYRIHFYCEAKELDAVGRVLDFSAIKERLCMWLEDSWDHRFLIWNQDPMLERLQQGFTQDDAYGVALHESLHLVSFNPTAENMAEHLLNVVGPMQLRGTGVKLVRVIVEETRKCAAEASC